MSAFEIVDVNSYQISALNKLIASGIPYDAAKKIVSATVEDAVIALKRIIQSQVHYELWVPNEPQT